VTDPADPRQPAPPVPQPWAPPAAPPFGTPGYAAPPVYAPPPGYTGPYGAPILPVAAAPQTRRPTLGRVALVVAIVAAVVAPLAVGIATFNVGLGAGSELAQRPLDLDFDWSVMTPVRDWVLIAELSFWVGTALGVWAIVQGIIAVVTARGRRTGIAAVAVAVLGAILFAIALQSGLTAGLTAGSGSGG